MLRRKLLRLAAGLIGATALASLPTVASAQGGEPIKIGFSMSLTGPGLPGRRGPCAMAYFSD